MNARLLVASFLLLVSTATASAQTYPLPVGGRIKIDSTSVTLNERLPQGLRFGGTITGGSAISGSISISLVSKEDGETFTGTTWQSPTGAIEYYVAAPPGRYDVSVSFQEASPTPNYPITFSFVESTVNLKANTSHDIAIPTLTLNLVTVSVSGLSVGPFEAAHGLSHLAGVSVRAESKSVPGFPRSLEVTEDVSTDYGGSASVASANLLLPAGAYDWSVEQRYATGSSERCVAVNDGTVTESAGSAAVTLGANAINLTAPSFDAVFLSVSALVQGGNGSGGVCGIPGDFSHVYIKAISPRWPVTGFSAKIDCTTASFTMMVPAGEDYSLSYLGEDAAPFNSGVFEIYAPPSFDIRVFWGNADLTKTLPPVPPVSDLANVQGTLTSFAGAALNNCTIQFTDVANPSYVETPHTDASGHYSILLDPGTYSVVASCPEKPDDTTDLTLFRPSNGAFQNIGDESAVTPQWDPAASSVRRGFDGDAVVGISFWLESAAQAKIAA